MKFSLKKLLCLMLAMVLCFAMVACGDKDEKIEKEEKEEKEENKQQIQQEEQTDTPAGQEQGENQQEEENQQESAPAKPVDPMTFFSESAFIGDSVTLKLRNYNMANGALGNTTFLCQGSYSVAHAVNNTMMLNYQGSETTPQDALKACGAKRVFILLGMNDIALHGIDKTIENWGVLIANIRAACPGIEIYIQSGTPIYLSGEIGSLNNANMDKYNVQLKAFAEANDCTYIDVNTPFKNSSGGLAGAYCSDEYVHFTDAACALWIQILSEYVK